MNTSKSSYKRLMSLVLSVLMIVAMCSVSGFAAGNTFIYANGEIAANDKEYNEDVTVEIKGLDMDGVVVTVNGDVVMPDNDNSFVISVKEGYDKVETSDSPDSPDAVSAKSIAVVAEDGKYVIAVTKDGDPAATVAIFVKEKDAEDDTTDPTDETPDPTDETPDPTDETPDPTDETPDPTDETPDPTDETPDPTDETPDPTDETPDPTDETPDPSDETPDPSDETPDPTDETPDPTDETPDPETPDPETPDPETPDPLKPFYGDINLDGKVTAKDALLAQRYAINLEKLNEQQILNGDVDGKSAGGKKVTAADGMYILRHSIKLINKFPIEG